MGYIYLILSTFCNGAKGYASKHLSGLVNDMFSNAKLNAMRSVLCCIISIIVLIFSGNIKYINAPLNGIAFAAVSGIATAVFLISWLASVREGAYMMVGAFGNASFIVPLLGGVFILDEQIGLKKLLAIVMIVSAIFLMCFYNNKIKAKITPKMLAYLLLITLMQGVSQFLQKLFMVWTVEPNAAVYSFYTFLFSAVALVIFSFILKKSDNNNTALNNKAYVYIAVMAVALFFATYLQTLAAKVMDATVMYPLINVFSMLANVFMSTVLFREKLRFESIIGAGLALGAVLLYI